MLVVAKLNERKLKLFSIQTTRKGMSEAECENYSSLKQKM